MGNYMTKLFHTNENQKESNDVYIVKQQPVDSVMCTPLSEKKMVCDPRSVSAGILRTPIELQQLDAQDNTMCTPTFADKKILCDPRSISEGITRTPIETVMQDNSMSTPTLFEKKVLSDPHSISVGISKTPIEIECTPPVTVIKRRPSAIPKYLQRKKYLETDMDTVMPPLTPRKSVTNLIDSDQNSESGGSQDYSMLNINAIKDSQSITPIDKERYTILGLDPRSPAADFDRTPILIPKSLALIKARAREASRRRGSYESDMYNPTNLHQETNTSSISKIQIDITSETQETLDVEKQNESHILCALQQSDYDSSVIESEEEITIIKNPKCKNERENSLIVDEHAVVIDEEKNKDGTDKDNYKDIEHDMKTLYIKDDNEIEVWHDSLSMEENIIGKENEENIEKISQKKTSREDVIITFDECTTISALPKPIKIEKEDIARRNKKSVKIDTVTSNDKKNLNSENKMHGTEIFKNRTPLGNRSNNDQVQKINSPQHLSRNKAVSIKTEQENTPPYKLFNVKTKNGNHWDPNTTVLI